MKKPKNKYQVLAKPTQALLQLPGLLGLLRLEDYRIPASNVMRRVIEPRPYRALQPSPKCHQEGHWAVDCHRVGSSDPDHPPADFLGLAMDD